MNIVEHLTAKDPHHFLKRWLGTITELNRVNSRLVANSRTPNKCLSCSMSAVMLQSSGPKCSASTLITTFIDRLFFVHLTANGLNPEPGGGRVPENTLSNQSCHFQFVLPTWAMVDGTIDEHFGMEGQEKLKPKKAKWLYIPVLYDDRLPVL